MENKKNDTFSGIDLADPEQQEAMAQKIYTRMKQEGKSLQETLNVSDSLLEEIYGVAYSYYSQGKYKEAISLFYFIISVTPKNAKYAFGFAASLYQLKDYENAVLGFYMAHAVNQKDPLSAFYVADCCLKMNQNQEADHFLDLAIHAAGTDGTHATLKERCTLIKSALHKKI